MSVIWFFIIFGIIVIVHEFGHFIVARMNGIRVVEFMIGMGPKLVGIKRGETEYTIRLLPIGGACLFDMDDGLESDEQEKTDSVDEHKFQNANIWSRIATVLAGPMFNFLLAFVFSIIVVAFSGSDKPVIYAVSEDGAAMEAGLRAGDTITRINHEKIHLYRQVSVLSALNQGEELTITYERDGQKNTVTLTPRYDEETKRYYIGLIGSGEFIDCKGLKVLEYSFYEMEYWVNATVKSLKMLVTGKITRDDVAGPVGMAKMVGDTYETVRPYGLSYVVLSMMNIVILLSVNLGIMNLLPIPAIDGGRLLFLLVEVVRGKPIPPEKEGVVHLIGMVLLMVLMIFVFFNDLSKIFHP